MCSVNGEEYTPAEGETIADLVEKITGGSPRGIAVSRDLSVVPRSQWSATPVTGQIDILTAAQGG